MKKLLFVLVLLAVLPEQSIAKSIGNWFVSDKSSKIDGTRKVSIVKTGKAKIRKFSGVYDYPTLHISCRENKTSVTFGFGDEYFPRISTEKHRYKIDNDAAKTIRLVNFDIYASLDEGAKSIEFTKSMISKSGLVIESKFNEVEFDLTGLDKALKPVREACSW